MKHEELIKDIEERIKLNYDQERACRYPNTLDNTTRKYGFQSNTKLSKKIIDVLKSSEEYNRGADDAWELAKQVITVRSEFMPSDVLKEVFGTDYCDDILSSITGKEALAKVKEYEQKKKEEAERPVVGDVVNVKQPDGYQSFNGIFIREITENSNGGYVILGSQFERLTLIGKDVWKIEKTGKHFDIQGMLDEIG